MVVGDITTNTTHYKIFIVVVYQHSIYLHEITKILGQFWKLLLLVLFVIITIITTIILTITTTITCILWDNYFIP